MLGKLYVKWCQFRFDRSGVTAVEYGVMAAAIVVVIIATVILIGPELKTTFTTIKDELVKINTPG